MNDGEQLATSRAMWYLLETFHAIVYFAPEVTRAFERVGLKGFWRGYFAGRAAPLGHATSEQITASFFNFHPAMVARAVPDIWQTITPTDAIRTRLTGVDDALGRSLGTLTLDSADMTAAADLAADAVHHCPIPGRPFFAAHLTLDWPHPAHLRLWHAATLLREHRGDGHVAANLAHGFDGLASLVTATAGDTVPRASIQPHRGWSDDEWADTTRTLTDLDILDAQEQLTEHGRAQRQLVEDTTDRLATEPWTALGVARTNQLADILKPIADTIADSGVLPYPNPMALPAPTNQTQT